MIKAQVNNDTTRLECHGTGKSLLIDFMYIYNALTSQLSKSPQEYEFVKTAIKDMIEATTYSDLVKDGKGITLRYEH